ncbi:MAG: transglycosylase domain-containing protein [Ignavibacteriales bacterium]
MPRKSSKLSKTETKKLITTVIIIGLLIIVGGATGLVLGAVANIPDWSPDKLYGAETTTLYDQDSKPFANLHAEENRIQVSLNKIPKDMINAFLATEDQNFYSHHGVSPTGIIRAVLFDMISGTKAQGASTITQQLARNAFLGMEKTWERKIKEMILAVQIENKYSKDEIMEFYLNRINFGSGAWGAQTAAEIYFDKDVEELDLAECALLTGLVKSPNGYSPFRDLETAKNRQRVVLNRMVDCGYISAEDADKAYEEKLHLNEHAEIVNKYGYFTDYVIDEADRILEEEDLFDDPQTEIFNGGLKIYTTMNSDVQDKAEDLYSNSANFPTGSNGQEVESAMVLLDHRTGEICALVGGRSYTVKRGFNRAVDAFRQPGSAFKPLVVYGPAVEAGYTPDYMLEDGPVTYSFGTDTWSPKNYDGKYMGMISMRTAVAYSVNIYAVKLADLIGIRNGVQFAEKLGISSLVTAGRSNDMNLSTALGGITKGVSPLEMASAYGCFANQGIHTSSYVISRIEDKSGNVIYENRPNYKRVMKKETAWTMTTLLQGVVTKGTGKGAQIPGVQCAGKTGTTQEDRDAWYVGYTPNYSCAVWMGYDKKGSHIGTVGGNYPAKIWKAVMTKAVTGKADKNFATPEGLEQVAICVKSGKLPSPACPAEDVGRQLIETDKVPKDTCDLHVLVDVCLDSGKLATPGCPNPVSKGFLKDALSGDAEAIPTGYCDIHGDGQGKITILVCRDPRNGSKTYLANVAGSDETGGCPQQYIEEMEYENPDVLNYCPLLDHQIQK